MGSENRAKANNGNKKRKPRYLPHNKPVKKKGLYPLRPGVQGFFITCDGGRERQASHEALNVIDSFFEELVCGKEEPSMEQRDLSKKPSNTKTKFTYSDSSSSDNDDDDEDDGDQNDEDNVKSKEVDKSNVPDSDSHPNETQEAAINKRSKSEGKDGMTCENNTGENNYNEQEETKGSENPEVVLSHPPAKKQCVEINASSHGNVVHAKKEEQSVDKLIEAELAELTDKTKRRFGNLDSGCNGVVFVQMRKRDGDPSPRDIVQHMMTSLASTKKHVSRFILRVLPIELACYASEEEIARAMKPFVEQYFPIETENPHKFAVLYDARANTGVDRMKIINAVAKSVPPPHKVDLSNPDINIVVQIVKTLCLIGFVEKYKELAKYNIRQLTSSNP